MSKTQATITVKQIKSPISRYESHRATLVGLGLNKLNRVSTLEDTPSVRGMINKVSYMLEILEETSSK